MKKDSKSGLQKKVSDIFKGVCIPGMNDDASKDASSNDPGKNDMANIPSHLKGNTKTQKDIDHSNVEIPESPVSQAKETAIVIEPEETVTEPQRVEEELIQSTSTDEPMKEQILTGSETTQQQETKPENRIDQLYTTDEELEPEVNGQKPEDTASQQQPSAEEPQGEQPETENTETEKAETDRTATLPQKETKVKKTALKKLKKVSALAGKLEKIKTKLLTPKPGVNPAKQKAMIILIPILFLVFIFSFKNVIMPPKKANAKTEFKPSLLGGDGAQNQTLVWKTPEPYPENLRDPMTFGTVKYDVEQGPLIVKGILYSDDNPSAVIGSQIAGVGNSINGVTIIKINKESVEFEKDGKRWTQKVQR